MPREPHGTGRPRAAFLLSGPREMLLAGSIAALLAVAGGAFGAHVLREILEPARLATYRTGIEYQMFHALALCVLGTRAPGAAGEAHLARAGTCFAAGIVVFSGSLYALAFGAPRALGMITPIGGALFLLGWAFCIAGAMRDGR
jgi:uncharacterized membrane protein YgdD (TMEM256/DUF423 family)